MANPPEFGIVEKVVSDIRRGKHADILLDDGRKFNVPVIAFSENYEGNGRTRFVTEEAYYTWKDKQLQKFINWQQNLK